MFLLLPLALLHAIRFGTADTQTAYYVPDAMLSAVDILANSTLPTAL